MIVTLLFGLIGWVDDYRKVVEKNPRIAGRWKYFWQSVVGLVQHYFYIVRSES